MAIATRIIRLSQLEKDEKQRGSFKEDEITFDQTGISWNWGYEEVYGRAILTLGNCSELDRRQEQGENADTEKLVTAFQNLKGKEGKSLGRNHLHICKLEAQIQREGVLFFLVHQNSPSSSFKNTLCKPSVQKQCFLVIINLVSLHHFSRFSSRNLENLGAYLVTRMSLHCFVNPPGTHNGTGFLQNTPLCAAAVKCGLNHWLSGSLFLGINSTLPITSYLIKELLFSCIAALPLIVRLLY